MFEGLAAQVLDAVCAGSPVRNRAIPPEPGIRDSAVAGEFAIGIRAPFPRIYGSQMRRAQLCNTLLAGGEVGNAGGANLAAAPWSRAGPFDQVVEIFGVLRRYECCVAL